MKKRKLLFLLPVFSLLLTGCDFNEILDTVKDFAADKVVNPVKDLVGLPTDEEDGDDKGGEQGGNEQGGNEQGGQQEKTIRYVQVASSPATVVQGGTLDVTAVTLTVAYSDKSEETVTPESIELDTSAVGVVTGYAVYKGQKAEFQIEVISASEVVHVTSIYLENKYPDMKVGEELQINVTFEPENATDKTLTYESEDPTKVSVSNTGLLKALAATTSDVKVTVTPVDNPEAAVVMEVGVTEVATGMPNATQAGYTKLLKDEALKNGEKINIAGAIGETYYVMPAYASGNNIPAKAITAEGGNLVVDAEDEFTVVKHSDGKYSFRQANGKYLAAVGGGNYLKVTDTIADTAKFEITVDEDGNATICCPAQTKGTICLNPNANNNKPLFSCYDSNKFEAYCVYHNNEEAANVAVTGVEFKDASYTVQKGLTVSVAASVTPSDATNQEITYSLKNLSPEGCMTISGNVITGVEIGTGKVVATSKDGSFEAEVPVEVIAEINPTHAGTAEDPYTGEDACIVANKLAQGAVTSDSYYIRGKVTEIKEAFNAQYGNYSFIIEGGFIGFRLKNGSSYASFNEGDIEIGDTVTMYVQIQNYGGIPESKNGYVVTVEKAPVAATGVTLDAESAELTVGATKTLVATVAPAKAVQDVTWTSSEPTVATVDGGVVTATGVGTATITAAVVENPELTATCTITVVAGTVAVTGVALDKTTASLVHIPGEAATLTLTATLAPESPTNQNVTWSSDNTAVATVENGVVTTVGGGTANITVTTEDGGFTATCAVTVTATTHAGTEADPFNGADACIVANNLPNSGVTTNSYYIKDEVTSKTGTFSATYGNFTFNFGDFVCYRMLKANSEKFTAESDLEVGDTVLVYSTIQNYYKNGTNTPETKTGYVVSVVKPAHPVTGVTLDLSEAQLTVGGTVSLTATVAPANADDSSVTWSSSDETVATVEAGVVTGVAAGSATITVTTTDGSFTATCAIEVVAGTIAVTGVALDVTEAEITVGDTKTLVATVAPATASDKTVTWSSSDETVATVEAGVVTGVAAGSATITVTTTDGSFTATCAVTVNKKTEYVYTRVTSATDVTAGGTFIIGYEKTAKSGTIVPMLLTNSGSYMNKGDEISMSTLSDPTAYMVTVGASTSVSGAVTLKAGTKFIGNENTKNSAKLFDKESEYTAFGVTVGTDDVVTLKIEACTSYHTLQYNASSPRFACYGGTQKSPVMYKVTVK